ncbi:hypothetical protein AGMMS50239_09940 [Bacteroidia bacterium]|nr:hypothetical protein AGMMS50239_09940 [Bacteroidia bacterium]
MLNMNKLIKIGLSFLLLLCLLDMPYGYYQFVRFIALVGFAVLAYFSYQQGRDVEMIVFIALAILFQPFIKIALGRVLWNSVDVVVGIGLLISLFRLRNKS